MYEPKIIYPGLIRIYFEPPLSNEDASDTYLMAIVQAVEQEIIYRYNNGVVPTDDLTKVAAVLLALSYLFRNPKISEKYQVKQSVKIGEYSYTIGSSRTVSERLQDLATYYEQKAKELLATRSQGGFFIALV